MAKAKPAANDKAKYRVLRAISWIGERKEVGSIVEMTAEQAAGIGEEYLAKVEGKEKKSKPESGAEEKADEAKTDAAEEGKEIDI